MKRRAIIIEGSAVSGQDKLPGAAVDAQSWKKYLTSAIGGAWEPSEIELLSNPSPSHLLSRIAAMSGDYGFIAFSGHGLVVAGTTLMCAEGGLVSEQQLIANPCSRLTLVLDCCRGIEEQIALAKAEIITDSVVDRSAHRRLFDDAVLKAELGTCRLYGCDFDQAANEEEDGTGGFFTQALIGAGRSITGRGVLYLNNAFQTAAQTVRHKDPRQTPTSTLGRRMHHFPFAVSA